MEQQVLGGGQTDSRSKRKWAVIRETEREREMQREELGSYPSDPIPSGRGRDRGRDQCSGADLANSAATTLPPLCPHRRAWQVRCGAAPPPRPRCGGAWATCGPIKRTAQLFDLNSSKPTFRPKGPMICQESKWKPMGSRTPTPLGFLARADEAAATTRSRRRRRRRRAGRRGRKRKRRRV